MVFINKFSHLKQSFVRGKTSLIISAVLTIPSALLISFIYYSLNSKPYSISHLQRAAIILSGVLFWVLWWIVNRNQNYLLKIFNSLFLTSKHIATTRIIVLFFIVLLITVGLLSPIKFPQINSLTKPYYRYLIEMEPDQGNPGNICILGLKNSYGNIFRYNENVFNVQNSGSWKRDVYGCEHFLAAGTSGKITFENIGPIDDEIEITTRSDPKAGSLLFTTDPGTKKTINLRSGKNQNLTFVIHLGDIQIKKIANWGLKIGYVLILLVYLTLIPKYIYKKIEELLNNFAYDISDALRKQKHFNAAWHRLDSKATALVTISILFIAGVIFSVIVTNPLAYGPIHLPDEIDYWDIAYNIYKGTYTSLEFFYIQPPFYPISLLPAFFLFYPFGTYTAAKLLNALYITSAIIPAYLLLRKFIKRNLSIVAISILLLNPVQLVMPGRILTENIFYPIFMWAVLFAFTNVWQVNVKNRIFECLIFGILLGLLFLTRYIALALIPAFLLIWWLKPFENEKLPLLFSVRKFLHLIIIFIPLFLLIGGWINFGTAQGLRVKDTLGLFIAESPNPDQLSFSRLVMWMVFYCSYAVLIAAPYLPLFLASFSRFKLKDWQEDPNRWLIAVAAIILFFLAVCIRHSWRINYNYPTPLKIQGRYLLYFGPLFLITIFTSLEKPFKKMNRSKLIIFSSAMILAAYAFLFFGFIYLDGPLGISPSSPDGYLIKFMGISFVILTLTNVIISSLIINKRRIALLTIMVTFLIGFFFYGNMRILNNIFETREQRSNSQIYHLIQEYKTLSFESINKTRPVLKIFFPIDSNSYTVNLWRQTLNFNGYTDIELLRLDLSEDDPAIILQARNSNYSLSLKELDEKNYLISDNKKYSQFGKFYEFQLEPMN